jgi:hypothetical protein
MTLRDNRIMITSYQMLVVLYWMSVTHLNVEEKLQGIKTKNRTRGQQ